MTQFFNNIEPNVIDDEILQKAIEEKCPEDLGDIARKESINVNVVTEIQISFKKNLTKLQLDNNVIEKIEGLESLVHLVWLDLSFNNIEVIEGLDTLVKLQDLSLYSNRISTIEHMDTLQELQIFSIGNNNLTVLENVIYLRRLKSLQTLNLSGNPFCSEEHYRLFVVAHLPSLVYLDFKLVRKSTAKAAALKYQHLTKPLEEEEAQVLALQEVEDAKQKELEQQQAAFVEYLNGPFLFDSLHEEEGEATKLVSLPGVEELLQAYPCWEEFVSVCESLYNYGLEEYEKREAEVSKFYKRLHEILAVNQEESKRIISDFETRNEMRLDELYQEGSGEIADSKRAQGKEEIQQLWHALMLLETLVSNDLECRDLENQHFENVMEIVQAILKKIALFELEEDFPEDLRTLFEDKVTVVNIASVSHSIRLRKIDKRESDMLSNTYQWQKSMREKAFQRESDRNRACIEKIICFMDTLQKELDSTVVKPKE
ncbi:hypothetical protein EK904_009584 [Melospiza melodia maxima]|nr:hypothetical protein EK904_009584 [Melospiza melodia maxima]